MPIVLEGTLEEIVRQHPELSGKRVRVYVLESGESAANLRDFLGAWVGSIRVPPTLPASEVKRVFEESLHEKLERTSVP
jgi:hypothetical protein